MFKKPLSLRCFLQEIQIVSPKYNINRMKDNSWMSCMNKGNNNAQGKGGMKNAGAAKQGNKVAPKQMNRRTQ